MTIGVPARVPGHGVVLEQPPLAYPAAATADPCVLAVEFRLRAVRGRGHAAFRRESLLNTPLFAGFPGFVSRRGRPGLTPPSRSSLVAPGR